VKVIDIFVNGSEHLESAKQLVDALEGEFSNEGAVHSAGANARRQEIISRTDVLVVWTIPALIKSGEPFSVNRYDDPNIFEWLRHACLSGK
jgi:hypothetical protein